MENKTMNYGGKICKLFEVFDEEKNPNWSDEAQNLIDMFRKQGNQACVLHKGNLHELYMG